MVPTRNTDDRFFRRGFVARIAASFVVLLAITFQTNPALAQRGKPAPEPEQVIKSYTLPYFFSGVAVLLVVIPLCLPTLRLWEIPKDEDD
ncbi:MAG: hypothetical protein K8U03_17155 [Planctomycetia bacterium]|nr:hypothetical protein [Planctomycetia bacterium]